MIASLHEQMGENQKNMEVLENPWLTNLIRTGKIDKLDRDVVDDMIDTILCL